MRIKNITSRWVLTTLAIIMFILILVNIGFALSIKNYFYNAAEQMIINKASADFSRIQLYSTDMSKNMNNEIRSIVQSSEDNDEFEVMSINFSGQVNYTSSGFIIEGQDNPDDYKMALTSPDSSAKYIGYLDNGEHVMSYTQLILVANNEFSALRYMISLKEIDSFIFNIIITLIVVSAIVIIMVVISGFFFVNSIVKPVRDISAVVNQIASGDMSARINKHSNDELGELCERINHMADELLNSERLKNEFISSVSHELRTPLTAIQGWSETVLSVGTEDRETVFKGMKVINDETERLSEMVEELLDFSRIQSGRFKLVKDKMDVLAELEEAVLIYTQYAKRDKKELIFEEQNALPVIYGDKNRIRQVFINIIDNALKYSDEGDIIKVKAEVLAKRIVITVADTGCGIEEKDLNRVTDKFFKANNKRRGSGIGLAVVREIIDMHDGTFDIESKIGEGTKVTITFPILEIEDEEDSNDDLVNFQN